MEGRPLAMEFFKNFEIYGNRQKRERHFIIHSGPTNSGKTHDGIVAISQSKEKCLYAAPLRLLALEVFERFNREGIPCDLVTGEEKVVGDESRVVSCTMEAINFDCRYDVAVIDECHMIKDNDRGPAWTNAILNVVARTIHLCCDQSAVPLLQAIIQELGDYSDVVKHERNTPLLVDPSRFEYPGSVQNGDALIAFSRKAVLALAADLKKQGVPVSVIYGKLPPRVRREQYTLFNSGKTNVVVATDAIGMGLNMPIKRIVFMEDMKFNGSSMENLTDFEIKQVAGRAGRFGMYDAGLATVYPGGCHISKTDLAATIAQELPPIKKAKLGVPDHLYAKCKCHEHVTILHDHWLEMEINNKLFEKESTAEKDMIIEAYRKTFQKYSFNGTQINLLFKTNFNLMGDSGFVQIMLDDYGNKRALSRPKYHDGSLEDMERYSHQLDVFYSFANNFLCKYKEDEIVNQKEGVAKGILKFLMKKHSKIAKRCLTCGKELPWNFIHKRCDECHFGI